MRIEDIEFELELLEMEELELERRRANKNNSSHYPWEELILHLLNQNF